MASRIYNENYLDQDALANDYVSSEQAAFPVDNAYNSVRRSKVWRSNGYWEITSSNNTFTFKDTAAGGTLTASVTAANYTSTTSMLAALKTAMEAVGGYTYTCSVDATTSKISIASSNTEFQIVSGGTLNSVLGYSTLPKTGATSYLADVLRIHTFEYILWDFGISTNPDVFVLIGKRNSPIAITPGATIKLQGNSTNIWTSPEYEQTITYDDEIMSIVKTDGDDGLHTQALRFWRLYIQDQANPNGYVEIGALFLGKYYEPTRGAIQFPFTGDYLDASTNVFSEGGQTYSDRRQQSEAFSVQWSALTTSEKEEIDAIFEQYGTSLPFFVAFDPGLAFSSSANYYTRFVKFEKPPSYSLEAPNFWTVSMEFREEL
jgi:hypothetical protein